MVAKIDIVDTNSKSQDVVHAKCLTILVLASGKSNFKDKEMARPEIKEESREFITVVKYFFIKH